MTLTAAQSADASTEAATDPATPASRPSAANRSSAANRAVATNRSSAANPSVAATRSVAPDRQTSPGRPAAPGSPVAPGRPPEPSRPIVFDRSTAADDSARAVEPTEVTTDAADLVADAGETEERPPADRPVEFTVRPAQPLYGFVAGGSALLAVLFAVAAQSVGGGFGAAWRLAVAAAFAVLGLVGAWMLRSKPLLVADGTGIRLRIRSAWIGAPWEGIESVTVLPRRHMLDDGRIAVHLADPGPVVAAMDKRTRKITDANRRLTGSSLAVPFGLAATPSDPAVIAALTALADDRCPVTEQP